MCVTVVWWNRYLVSSAAIFSRRYQLFRAFNLPQLLKFRTVLVKAVQGIAAGDHTVTGGGGTVAAGATDTLALQWPAGEYISHDVRVAQAHPPDTYEVRLPRAHHLLSHVGQPFL